jgi:hypothetical protein
LTKIIILLQLFYEKEVFMRKKLCLFAVLILLTSILYSQDEESEVMSLILANASVKNRNITLFKKINMGIPGGDNWLVEWTPNRPGEVIRGTLINVYVIKDGNIILEKGVDSNLYTISEYSDFDIMNNIPGTRLGEGSCVVYDYNDDGFDEVFNYAFWGSQWLIQITGYDQEKKIIVDYAEIPFSIIDREKGPAPIDFTNYKGMKGFKIYFAQVEVAGGPGFVPDPHPYNGKWIFFTWDKEKRKFVDIGEYTEESVSEESVSDEAIFAQYHYSFGEKNNIQEDTITSVDDKGKKYIFIIGIILSVIMAVAIIWFIKKKKK